MAGLIDGAQKAPASTGKTSPKKDSSAVNPAMVRAKMSIPPQLQDVYARLVLAAKKLLYSQQLKPQVEALLKGPGSIGDKLGHGAVALMAILHSQTNGNMPPQLIIPVATEMVAEAGDFLRKAGMKVTDDDIAEGMAVMVAEILQRAGVTPDKLPELLKQQGPVPPQGAPDQPAGAPAPAPPVSPDGRPQMGAPA